MGKCNQQKRYVTRQGNRKQTTLKMNNAVVFDFDPQIFDKDLLRQVNKGMRLNRI
jgi:hypothetical protein